MKVSVKIVGVVVVAMALVIALSGCPRKAPEPTGAPPVVGGPPVGSPTPQVPVGELNTLADVWDKLNANSSYELTMTMPDGKVVTQLMKLEDGKPVKMRMNNPDGSSFVLMDMKEHVIHMCAPEENMAMKMEMSASGGEGGTTSDAAERVFGPDSIESDVELKTSETLDGVECWLVETTTKGTDEDTVAKIWVNKSTGLLVQMEAEGETIRMEYSRLNDIADSEFELPEGMEIMDMSELAEGIGEAMSGEETAP